MSICGSSAPPKSARSQPATDCFCSTCERSPATFAERRACRVAEHQLHYGHAAQEHRRAFEMRRVNHALPYDQQSTAYRAGRQTIPWEAFQAPIIRDYLEGLLAAARGNLCDAARRAGVHRNTLMRWLDEHNLRRYRFHVNGKLTVAQSLSPSVTSRDREGAVSGSVGADPRVRPPAATTLEVHP